MWSFMHMQEDDKWQLLGILKKKKNVFVDESPETMLENLLKYKLLFVQSAAPKYGHNLHKWLQ